MSVTVPASVIQVLKTNNVVYQLKAVNCPDNSHPCQQDNGEAACVARSMLLQDAQGTLQIILPACSMLDLSAVKSQFGRNLEPLHPHELEKILSEHELKTVPAIPEWQGLPTLVDSSLLHHQVLLLDTGGNREILELKIEDFQGLIKACNIGEIGVTPPPVPDSTREDKEQILFSLNNFTQLRIKKRLEETLELPPLPETALRIIKLRADSDADISDLTSIVELDPSLAAQIVSWASSPYYSAPGKIKSVHDAIIRVLGFDMVLNLALGLALGKTMNNKSMNTQQISDYWYTAVCTAATVEGLVTSIPRENRPSFGMAYLSGLLNNFGQLILAEVFPPYYANINRHCSVNTHIPQATVEQQLIGVSNCQICAWLMKAWNMPEEVVTAIRHQNNPDYDGEHNAYAKLNYLAKQLLANQSSVFGTYKKIDSEIYSSIHLEQETAEIAVENILKSAEDLKAISNQIQG